MTIHIKEAASFVKVKLDGKFNIEEVVDFEKETDRFINKNYSVIGVDFTHVEYIDSSALGSLIKFLNITKSAKINLYIYNLNINIHNIFKLAFLDKFFNIVDSDYLNSKYSEIKW
jgi:anti-anti-sigma factor